MNSEGKGRCAERSGIAVWVPIVLFRFERKIRSEFIKREAGDEKMFLIFLFCLHYVYYICLIWGEVCNFISYLIWKVTDKYREKGLLRVGMICIVPG